MNEEKISETTPFSLRYILPDDWSEAKKEANPIAAEKVVEAIKSGKKVEIINAVIEGTLILKSLIVEDEVTIRRTKFRGSVDWSYAVFKQVLSLVNSTFETDAIFTEAIIEKDIFLDKVTFHGKVEFSDFTITGVFYSRSTTFKKGAIFAGAIFKKRIEFIKSIFEGNAVFAGTQIGVAAYFSEAQFKQQANFTSSHIEGEAFFDSAIFGGDANFFLVRIGSSAYFDKAQFKQQAIFTSFHIEGEAFFDSIIFEGEAHFELAWIGNSARFDGAQFKQQAIFYSSQIEGDALFNLVIFDGMADFLLVRIGSYAYFSEAQFKQQANFASSHIEGEAFFDSAIFGGDANFFLARIGGITSFNETIFSKDINLKYASFRTISFVFTQFNEIDMRGCIYDSIHPTSLWEQLMDHLDPYDRQPFNQLEGTFRRAGMDELANDVYYMRKCRESTQKTIRNPVAWLADRFLWLVTGYGVRLSRLFVAIALILVVGTYIFHLEGAVESKLDIQMTPLAYGEAFWVSLNIFLPIEIPSGADWKPTSQIMGIQTQLGMLSIKFTTFATLLKLAGWIFVPVGIAGISGILKR